MYKMLEKALLSIRLEQRGQWGRPATDQWGGPYGAREGRVPPAALRIPTSRARSRAVQLCKTGPIAADRQPARVRDVGGLGWCSVG